MINPITMMLKKKICKNIMMKNLRIMSKRNNKQQLANPQLQENSFKISKHFIRTRLAIQAFHRQKNQK